MTPSPVIRFSRSDIDLFSAASGDRNPLHLSEQYARRTAYGEPVVFGQLGVFACMAQVPLPAGRRIARLRIDFLRPLFLDVDYRVHSAGEGSEWNCALFDGSIEILRIGIATEIDRDSKPPVSHAGPVFARHQALRRSEEEIVPGLDVSGRYHWDQTALDKLTQRWNWPDHSWLPPALCWSSYLIGMELPGESALFARLDLNLPPKPFTAAPFDYAASVRSLDNRTGQVNIAFDLTADGVAVASGELRSYIRPDDSAADTEIASAETKELMGQVALVIGASRGLGAATKKELESRDATVYSLSRSGSGGKSVCGDATDPLALQQLREQIVAEHGRLDILVCNAFPALLPLRMEPNALQRIQHYMNASLALVLAPMCAFLDLLEAANGRLVVISSAAVENPVREWPHYIAAKRAIEGIAEVAALQYPHVSVLVVRPEKMLTAMTNTPMGRRGALPPALLAARIAQRLVRPLEQGRATLMREN
jgi:NAD(P)-dependent dehydrogenase (short-subunit alcohol dehydrogenase family)